MHKQKEYSLKQVLLFLMLGVYVFGLIKPALPLVKDVLAHTFFKSSHMATVHYENGRYHLHLELKEEAKNIGAKQNALLSYEVLAYHIKTDELNFTPYIKKTMEINSPYINISTDVFIPQPLLPPQC